MDNYRDDYEYYDQPYVVIYVSSQDSASKRIVSTLYQFQNLTDEIQLVNVIEANRAGTLPKSVRAVPTLIYTDDDGVQTVLVGNDDIEPWLEEFMDLKREELIEEGEVGKSDRLLPANARGSSKWSNKYDKRKINFNDDAKPKVFCRRKR